MTLGALGATPSKTGKEPQGGWMVLSLRGQLETLGAGNKGWRRMTHAPCPAAGQGLGTKGPRVQPGKDVERGRSQSHEPQRRQAGRGAGDGAGRQPAAAEGSPAAVQGCAGARVPAVPPRVPALGAPATPSAPRRAGKGPVPGEPRAAGRSTLRHRHAGACRFVPQRERCRSRLCGAGVRLSAFPGRCRHTLHARPAPFTTQLLCTLRCRGWGNVRVWPRVGIPGWIFPWSRFVFPRNDAASLTKGSVPVPCHVPATAAPKLFQPGVLGWLSSAPGLSRARLRRGRGSPRAAGAAARPAVGSTAAPRMELLNIYSRCWSRLGKMAA